MPTYGLEIELNQISDFSPTKIKLIGTNRLNWSKTHDGSFSTCSEYKFRWPTNSLYEAKQLVHQLYSCKEFVDSHKSDSRAGIHVHIGTRHSVRSWWAIEVNTLSSKNRVKLQTKVDNLTRLFLRRTRHQWCPLVLRPSAKYSPINFSSEYDTLEFRIFNSCHNARYVCKCLDWSTDLWNYMIMLYNKETSSSLSYD